MPDCDPFDGRSYPDAWSGLPLFSGPTTVIAHIDHSRFFHLGFETDCPEYGDFRPALLNARMELFESNWAIKALRFSTLVAILASTRALCKKWLSTLAEVGLVSPASAVAAQRALDSDLDMASLRDNFGYNGISQLEIGWNRAARPPLSPRLAQPTRTAPQSNSI